MEEASLLVHKKTKTLKQAVKWVKATFGVTLSKPALKKHAWRKPGVKPKKQGGQLILPEEQEQRFISYIRLFRSMKLPTLRDIMLPILNRMLEGTGLQHRFKNKEATKYWWWSFCKRHQELFGTTNQRKHKLQRERWTQSQHLEEFYDVLQGVLLETGIAVPNPEYDSTVKFDKENSEAVFKAQPIIIVKPNLLASTDKTEVTCNMSCGSTMGQTSSKKILAMKDSWDTGEVLTNKTSQLASMYGGSLADGESLLPFAIFNCSPQLGWMLGAPTSSVVHETSHKRHTCAFTHNSSGGATGETFLAFLRANFHDTHNAACNPLLHDEPFSELRKRILSCLCVMGTGRISLRRCWSSVWRTAFILSCGHSTHHTCRKGKM